MVQPGRNSHDEYPAGRSREQDISSIRHWLATVKDLASCSDLDFEEARKRKLFAILTIPGIFILFAFSWYHLSHANLTEGLLDLAAVIWLIVTLAAFRLMKTAQLIYRANAALIGSLFIYLAIQGGVDGNKLMSADAKSGVTRSYGRPPLPFKSESKATILRRSTYPNTAGGHWRLSEC